MILSERRNIHAAMEEDLTMTRITVETTPEEAIARVLGTTGFALGLLLTISTFIM